MSVVWLRVSCGQKFGPKPFLGVKIGVAGVTVTFCWNVRFLIHVEL